MLRVITKVSPADLVTMANAVCAIIAITFFIRSVGGEFTQADANNISIGCCLLLVSMVLDGLDGKVARKFGSNHNYGKHLDSVADMVSFSITPGILIFCAYYAVDMNPSAQLILFGALIFAVVFGMWRLVVFIKEGDKYYDFIGLPTPSNCLLIICTCSLYVNYRVGNLDGIPVFEPVIWAITNPPQGLVVMGLVSILMMSTFVFIKLQKSGQIAAGLMMLGLFIALITSIQGQPLYFVFHIIAYLFALGYVILNIVMDVADTSKHGWFRRSRERRQEKKEKKDEKRQLKDEMRELRKEKKDLQKETRALRRMKNRLLGLRKSGKKRSSKNKTEKSDDRDEAEKKGDSK